MIPLHAFRELANHIDARVREYHARAADLARERRWVDGMVATAGEVCPNEQKIRRDGMVSHERINDLRMQRRINAFGYLAHQLQRLPCRALAVMASRDYDAPIDASGVTRGEWMHEIDGTNAERVFQAEQWERAATMLKESGPRWIPHPDRDRLPGEVLGILCR